MWTVVTDIGIATTASPCPGAFGGPASQGPAHRAVTPLTCKWVKAKVGSRAIKYFQGRDTDTPRCRRALHAAHASRTRCLSRALASRAGTVDLPDFCATTFMPAHGVASR